MKIFERTYVIRLSNRWMNSYDMINFLTSALLSFSALQSMLLKGTMIILSHKSHNTMFVFLFASRQLDYDYFAPLVAMVMYFVC